MDPKLFLFSTLLLSAFESCKKVKPGEPQQEIRLIDFESRLPIEDVLIYCVRDEFLETPLGRSLLPYTYQTLHSDEKGAITYNFLNGGYLKIEAEGYMSRKIEMTYAKGELEMLKSAPIEVQIMDAHIATSEITQLDVIREDDLQLPLSLRESFAFAYESIAHPTGNYTVHFDGLANRENKIKITFFSDSIRDTSIAIVPAQGAFNKVQLKY